MLKKVAMSRFAYRLVVACCAASLPLAAHAAAKLSIYLQNYYTEYQVVTDCAGHAHLSAADAAKAKDAMTKIEAYYLRRDPSIKKDVLMKQAVVHKNAAFKIMRETTKVDTRQFCLVSLNDLIGKAHDILSGVAPK
jgi:hypothetical protein